MNLLTFLFPLYSQNFELSEIIAIRDGRFPILIMADTTGIATLVETKLNTGQIVTTQVPVQPSTIVAISSLVTANLQTAADYLGPSFAERSAAVQLTDITPTNIDWTGAAPKMVFTAPVNIFLHPSDNASDMSRSFVAHHNVYLSLGLTNGRSIVTHIEAVPPYSDAAIYHSEYALAAGYGDAKNATSHVNQIFPSGQTLLTAAAYEMAHLWYHGLFLRSVNAGLPPYLVSAHPGNGILPANRAHTCYITAATRANMTIEALGVAAMALAATHVLPVGFGGLHSVYVANDQIPQTVLTERSFWEAYAVLRFTGTSVSSSRRFDLEFLFSLSQLMPLHGNCDEGGIYRSLWDDLPVSPNRAVLITNWNTATEGYCPGTSSMIIANVIFVQALVARAVAETYGSTLTDGLLIANISGNVEAARMVAKILPKLGMILDQNFHVDTVWVMSYLTTNALTHDPNRNRHLRLNGIIDLRRYTGFLPSYRMDYVNSNQPHSDSHYNYDKDSLPMLHFGGQDKLPVAFESNRLVFDVDLSSGIKFGSPLYFLQEFNNQLDGLALFDYSAVKTIDGNTLTSYLPFVDGQYLIPGQPLTQAMWHWNWDLFNHPGCLQTVPNLRPQFNITDSLRVYLHSYTYEVSVGQYICIGKQPNEGNVGSHVHPRLNCHAYSHSHHLTIFPDRQRPQQVDIMTWANYVQHCSSSEMKYLQAKLTKAVAERAAAVSASISSMTKTKFSYKEELNTTAVSMINGYMIIQPMSAPLVSAGVASSSVSAASASDSYDSCSSYEYSDDRDEVKEHKAAALTSQSDEQLAHSSPITASSSDMTLGISSIDMDDTQVNEVAVSHVAYRDATQRSLSGGDPNLIYLSLHRDVVFRHVLGLCINGLTTCKDVRECASLGDSVRKAILAFSGLKIPKIAQKNQLIQSVSWPAAILTSSDIASTLVETAATLITASPKEEFNETAVLAASLFVYGVEMKLRRHFDRDQYIAELMGVINNLDSEISCYAVGIALLPECNETTASMYVRACFSQVIKVISSHSQWALVQYATNSGGQALVDVTAHASKVTATPGSSPELKTDPPGCVKPPSDAAITPLLGPAASSMPTSSSSSSTSSVSGTTPVAPSPATQSSPQQPLALVGAHPDPQAGNVRPGKVAPAPLRR